MISFKLRPNIHQKVYVFGLNDQDLEKLRSEKSLPISENPLVNLRLEYGDVDQYEVVDLCLVCRVSDTWIEDLKKFPMPATPFPTVPCLREGHFAMFAYGKTDEECAKNVRRRVHIEMIFAGEWKPWIKKPKKPKKQH